MRLAQTDARAIAETVGTFLASKSAHLYLYGSRTRDELRGGDVDLVLVVPTHDSAATLRRNQHRLLAALKRRIGERRIDLSIVSEKQLKEEPFWRDALQE